MRDDRAADLNCFARPVERAGVVAVLDDVVVDAAPAELPEPEDRIDGDDPDRDDGERPRGDVVAERDHAALLPGHERHPSLLCMETVLGLVPDRRLWSVEDVLGDLLTVMRR